MEQEELISATRRDYESLQQEMNRISAENESAKEEAKEVLQVLITSNYIVLFSINILIIPLGFGRTGRQLRPKVARGRGQEPW